MTKKQRDRCRAALDVVAAKLTGDSGGLTAGLCRSAEILALVVIATAAAEMAESMRRIADKMETSQPCGGVAR